MKFDFGTYETFIYKRTYARWLDKESRREDFDETVDRYGNFFVGKVPEENRGDYTKALNQIKSFDIMPSMRAFFTAGEALKREPIAGYNCCAVAVDTVKTFSEILYILMNGTGVGFSVERQVISKLPSIPDELEKIEKVVVFADSKKGWAKGLDDYLKCLWKGKIPEYDLSKIRPKGERLKTFGGKASGPEPLDMLLKHCLNIISNATGRRLTSIECHDLCCHIANAVVVGGVRRSACISLSNLSDERMRNAKSGEFWLANQQRFLSNNSVVYTEKPDIVTFMSEWQSLIKSKTGERGVFNRESCEFIVNKTGRRKTGYDWLCNPCSEIILRPDEFCNLTEVVVRPWDTEKTLIKKIKNATILGCLQSTLTEFKFVNQKFKKNCEDERLLGVSLTGLRDHPILNHVNDEAKAILSKLKITAVSTAKKWSKILGINMPAAVTCVKPSGTTSQMVNSASGLHPRMFDYYIRRVRVTANDALAKFLIDKGVNYNPEVGETMENANTYAFDFPIKSPEGSVTSDSLNAIEQLKYWLMLQEHYCEHKGSCTIYVGNEEWLDVGAWVYKNWNYVSGISFLPKDDALYQLPPYEEIDEDEYETMSNAMPKIDWDEFNDYEVEDNTIGAQEYACAGGSCELK